MTPNPHDRLTKAIFGNPVHAAGELKSVLPRGIADSLDFDTLTVCSGDWYDKVLANRQGDLLFSIQARAAGEALIYVLMEHKSTLDPMTPLQLLGYMVRLWEAWLSQKPTAAHLPPILPVVLAHGSRKWKSPRRFGQLFPQGEELGALLAPFQPEFCFLVDDLTAQPDQAIRERAMTPLGKLTLLALKHMRGERELVEMLADWVDLLREASQCQMEGGRAGGEAFSELFCYTLEVRKRTDVKQVERFIAMNVDKSMSETFVSMADELRAEGRRQGRAEGRNEGLLEGKRLILVQLLTTRFGRLAPEISARLAQAGQDELDRWAQRILIAESPADVFGEGKEGPRIV
ncbi:MAG: Rpn family recombination-promoting nuclease/putative transposase [Planctomycetota bacterium]